MTHRPVRSLAALLAVLMVLFAFPALPIFAASSVKNITISFEGIEGTIMLYNGSKSFSDAFDEEEYVDLESSEGVLTIGTTSLTVSKAENGIKLTSGVALTKNLRLGVAIMPDSIVVESLDYSVKNQGISDSITTERDSLMTEYYSGVLYMSFASAAKTKWSEIASESIEIVFSVPVPTHSITFAGDTSSYDLTKFNDKAIDESTDFSAVPEKEDGNKFEFTVDEKNEAKAYYTTKNASTVKKSIELVAGVVPGTRTYTFSIAKDNFNDDITIYITVTPITYNIEFSPKELHAGTYDVSYNGDATAVYDGRFQFTVTPHRGYGAPKVELAEEANASMSQSKPTSDGSITYSIEGIKGDITVNITAGKEEKYAVNVVDEESDGYTVEVTGEGYGENQAKGGASLSIAVTVDEGYTNSSPTVFVDGVQLTGGHKVDNTTTFTYTMPYRAITITVGSVAKNTYTVTPPQSGAGYTVSPSIPMTVAHGDTAVFTVTLQPGFEHKATDDLDLKDLFKESDGIESVVYNKDSATFTVTIKGTKTTAYEIADQKIVAITYTVGEESHGEGYSFNCTQGSVGYNRAATFTVKPDTGYYITGIEYTVGDDATPISLDAKNGVNFSYSIQNVQGNIKVRVTCVPIKVKVTYIYPNVDFYGLTISGSNVTKEYTFGDEELVAEGGLKFKPAEADSETVAGLVFGGWQHNDAPVPKDGLALSASQCDANGEISINLTASLSAKISDRPDENSGGEQDATVYVQDSKTDYDSDLKNIQLSGTVSSALNEGVLAKLSGEIKVLRVGTVYARNDSLSDSTLRQYEEKIKGMTIAGFVDDTDAENSNIYAYVHSAVNFNLNKSTYTQKINLSGADGHVTRYGCMFFVIEISNQTYIFFGQIHTFDFDITASGD